MVKILIAGGTGFIGQALVNKWLNQGKQITVLGRDLKKIKNIYGQRVNAISWEHFEKKGVEHCQQHQVIINLCGANIGAQRWSDQRKQTITSSRIETSKMIGHACAELGPAAPRWLNASGIGIYGLQENLKGQLPEALTESTPIQAQPHVFLSELGHDWEATTVEAEASGVNVVKLRFAVVLAKHGGVLPKVAKPFYFFMGGPIGSGQQPFCWIALTDLMEIFDFILAHPELHGVFNCAAPNCIAQKEFAKALATQLKRPSMIPLPSGLVTLLFGQMGKELLLYGQHVKPKRLLELGFQFKYPRIESALNHIFSTPSGAHFPS